jgi:ribonucleoside-diphosphate reductase alpha chain
VPLEVYVSTFAQIRFEPSGMTNDADIRVAKSIVDYIFRWMGKRFPLGRGPGGGRDPVA